MKNNTDLKLQSSKSRSPEIATNLNERSLFSNKDMNK
jgi:hypothetical protein